MRRFKTYVTQTAANRHHIKGSERTQQQRAFARTGPDARLEVPHAELWVHALHGRRRGHGLAAVALRVVEPEQELTREVGDSDLVVVRDEQVPALAAGQALWWRGGACIA